MTDKNKGWVKLWREQFQHWVSERKPWCDGYAWSYLYARANYKNGIVNFRNQYIPLKRGQFVTSILKLSKTFGWTWRRTRSFLENLQNEEMLIFKFDVKSKRKSTKLKEECELLSFSQKSHNEQHNRFLTITILNYERFQSSANEDNTTDVIIDAPTDAQQTHTNKKYKEVKNIGRSQKQTDPRVRDFLNFWGETFQKETGQPYVFSYGKEGKLIKDLLKVHSFEALQETMRIFFRDEQARRRGLTIGIFRQEVNRLLSLKALDPLEQAKRELKEDGR